MVFLRAFASIVQYFVLALTFGMAVYINYLDYLGQLEQGNALAQSIPRLTLLGIGAIALFLIIDHAISVKRIERGVDSIPAIVQECRNEVIASLQGVQVRSFPDGADFLEYSTHRLAEASSIDDVNWSDYDPITTGREVGSFRGFHDAVDRFVKRDTVSYREIAMFSNADRLDRVRKRIKAKSPGYHVGYFEPLPRNQPPLMTFAIQDHEEVVLCFDNKRLAIRHREIVDFYATYYESLWNHSKKLKVGSDVRIQDLQRVLDSLS